TAQEITSRSKAMTAQVETCLLLTPPVDGRARPVYNRNIYLTSFRGLRAMMRVTHPHSETGIAFKRRASYQIQVCGEPGEVPAEAFPGMTVEVRQDEAPAKIILTGRVTDQTALNKLLKALFG